MRGKKVFHQLWKNFGLESGLDSFFDTNSSL
jgi:hypothetical protein